ncbi:putative ribonuclease H-like domain-containing protein [Tanacetum coccineum]
MPLLTGKSSQSSHFKPFGCHVTILNTSDHLGKFDGKADEGYIVGYSVSNKAYRVYNVPNKRVEETMNLRYLEEKPNVQGLGHEWYFDLDYLTDTLGYKRDKANQSARTQEDLPNSAGTQDADSDSECNEQVIIIPSYPSHNIQEVVPKDIYSDEVDDTPLDSAEEIFQKELARLKGQEQRATSVAKDTEEFQTRASTKSVPPGCIPVPTGSIQIPFGDTTISPGSVPVPAGCPTDSFFDNEPTTRFPTVQTRSKVNKTTTGESAFIIYIHDQQRTNHTDFQHCMFACFLSQVEPRSVAQALEDPSWVDAMQEEMQQFKFQSVWVLADLPEVVRIEAIRLFLAFASYMGFIVYQMDVKSAFLYRRIDEEVYVTQPKGFVDPQHPKKVYKVVKALYGLHQAPRAWYATLSTFLLTHGYRRGTIDKTLFLKKHKRDIILVQVYVDDIIFGSTKKAWCDEFEALMKGEFEMSAMGELTFFLGLQVQQRPDGIFISQDKYVQEILKKFDLECVRTATTPYEAPKPKSKNEPDSPVNVHLYRSMIGSLMYLTASRPDIMFAVSACSRNQVTPTTSNLEAVKKIFKYLKGQPRLGLWYPRESPFVLEAYSDSDYAGANKDRKSTTGGCQFLGRRLISWQCKKQTIVATSSTEAEYVAAANCCGQFVVDGVLDKLCGYGPLIDPCGYYNLLNILSVLGSIPPPIPETIPETRHESDHSQDHLSTPPRQQATPPVAPVFEHGQRTDPNIASSSRVHETEDDSLGGSFHVSPPRFTQASPTGHTSGGAEDHITLSALSSVVSTLVQKVNSLETELKAHKKLFKDVVPKLVKKVKALEVKLKTKKRKVVLSDSDQEEGGEQAVDLDALIALANAAVTVDSTKSPGGASSNPAACSYDPTSDVPTTAVPIDVPSGVDPTGPSTVSPGSTTVPTSSSIPADESILARSGTTTATPSSPVKDARKGKGVAVEEPTPTQDKETFHATIGRSKD